MQLKQKILKWLNYLWNMSITMVLNENIENGNHPFLMVMAIQNNNIKMVKIIYGIYQ